MAIRTRSPTLRMSGPLPGIPPHAIRTGSWLAREAVTKSVRLNRGLAVLYVAAAVQAFVPFLAFAAHRHHTRAAAAHAPVPRSVPYPRLDLPLQINGGQYVPIAWTDITGWGND